jgi:hypothetical protein
VRLPVTSRSKAVFVDQSSESVLSTNASQPTERFWLNIVGLRCRRSEFEGSVRAVSVVVHEVLPHDGL